MHEVDSYATINPSESDPSRDNSLEHGFGPHCVIREIPANMHRGPSSGPPSSLPVYEMVVFSSSDRAASTITERLIGPSRLNLPDHNQPHIVFMQLAASGLAALLSKR